MEKRYLLQTPSNMIPYPANPIDKNRRQLVFGPPANYRGPRPSYMCELYVTNIPPSLNVRCFLNWLNRLGPVFEMRLMMNTSSETRGYCFIRFFEEKAAIAAFELLSFLFLNGKRPNAQISQCKRQLFVGGIPKTLSTNEVRFVFQKLFGVETKCIVYPQSEVVNGCMNRGFAFLDFVEHDAALEAKKYLKHNRIWGQSVKVDWARPNEMQEPAALHSSLRKNDYSAKLRLYALANNWCIPIVCYGGNYKEHGVQYGGILLKDPRTAFYSVIIVEVVGIVFDIHVLLCEVATHLIEVFCGLPQKHFIVRARYGVTAKILYSFKNFSELSALNSASYGFVMRLAALELLTSLEILAQYNSEIILKIYKDSFRSQNAEFRHLAEFALIDVNNLSHFYCIYPKFRGNYPLNNNFNDTEIVLLQANAKSIVSSYMTAEEFEILLNAKTPDEGAFMLKSQRFNRHMNYLLFFVDAEMLRKCAFYHPSQQHNTPPLWVNGKSYQTSIYEVP